MIHSITRRALVAAMFAAASAAQAQTDSTIPIVVPSAAGSAPDIVARLVGDELRTRLGVPTLIDNKPGAGGIVAVMATKTSPSSFSVRSAGRGVGVVGEWCGSPSR